VSCPLIVGNYDGISPQRFSDLIASANSSLAVFKACTGVICARMFRTLQVFNKVCASFDRK
jgi:hypothetical protein